MTPLLAACESRDAQSPRRQAPRLILQPVLAGASILPAEPITALYVKPRSLLLPRPGGQGSGSKETGTLWGGYGGGEHLHRPPQ